MPDPASKDREKGGHTPGPWIVFADRGVAVAVLPAMRPGEICSMEGSGKPEREANAVLIAAAPDLLAAAKRALNVLKAQGEAVRPGNALGALDAAISKAEDH